MKYNELKGRLRNYKEVCGGMCGNIHVNKPSYLSRGQYSDDAREAPFNVASELLLVYIN